MQKYKLTIEFDGTDFSGWQIQPEDRTVEQVLEDAFSQILQEPVDLIGQGRTDAGVHARGQVAHVELASEVDIQDLLKGVNSIVGEEVQVMDAEKVAPDFHARFDAIGREYEYTLCTRFNPLRRHYSWILKQPVDPERLQECAALLSGEFDFAGFSKYNEDNFTTLCDIQRSEFIIEEEVIRYRIRANRFLRNMVRRLTGTMVRVAQGKMTVEEFREVLQNPASMVPTFTAPAKGLVLEKVFYKK